MTAQRGLLAAVTELPACCCSYGSPSSTTLVYQCFSPATQQPWWVHDTGHPRLFSRRAQSFTPDPPRESTLGQLGKSYKKKKRERNNRIRQVCTLATLGQKQQPKSGAIPMQGQLVAGGSLGWLPCMARCSPSGRLCVSSPLPVTRGGVDIASKWPCGFCLWITVA